MYSKKDLLTLLVSSYITIVKDPIRSELKRLYCRCRARNKMKDRSWRFKPFLPLIIMGNVNSLTNKSDELAMLVKNQRTYH